MIYQIGDIKTEWEHFVYPTQQRFEKWKKEFLTLPNVNKYNVWLCGGFLDDDKSTDVDIILTNEPNYSELRELLMKGFELGIKNKILVDIQHADKEPKQFFEGDVKKIVYGQKIIKGDDVLDNQSNKVYDDLYTFTKHYPTKKEYNRKPIKIN